MEFVHLEHEGMLCESAPLTSTSSTTHCKGSKHSLMYAHSLSLIN